MIGVFEALSVEPAMRDATAEIQQAQPSLATLLGPAAHRR
jgi:hypothetical protein